MVLLHEFLESNRIPAPSWMSSEMKNIELKLEGDYEMIVDDTYHHENQKDKQKEDIVITGHFKNKQLFRLILTPIHRIYDEPLVGLQFGSTTGFGGRPHIIQWNIDGERKKVLN